MARPLRGGEVQSGPLRKRTFFEARKEFWKKLFFGFPNHKSILIFVFSFNFSYIMWPVCALYNCPWSVSILFNYTPTLLCVQEVLSNLYSTPDKLKWTSWTYGLSILWNFKRRFESIIVILFYVFVPRRSFNFLSR